MRIRTILAAAAAPAALAAVLLGTTGTAFASTGPSGSSNGQQGHLTGNQSLTYQDPYFGGVQCNENQHPTFTNVTCKFVSGPSNTTNGGSVTSNAASFTPGQTGQVSWVNDFGGNSIIGINPATGTAYPSTNGTLTYTITGPVGGAATGYTGQVVYTT